MAGFDSFIGHEASHSVLRTRESSIAKFGGHTWTSIGVFVGLRMNLMHGLKEGLVLFGSRTWELALELVVATSG